MQYPNKSNNKKFPRWAIIVPTILLVAGGILLGLEKTNVINLYHSDTPTPVAQTEQKPVNQVDYTPASSTDNEDINKQKESGQIDTTPTTPAPTTTNNLNVTITSNTRPDKGSPLEVRAFISPLINSGTCAVTLTKSGSTTITKTAPAAPQGSYSTCGDLDISADKFSSAGTWDLSLVVTGTVGSKGEAKATVEITK